MITVEIVHAVSECDSYAAAEAVEVLLNERGKGGFRFAGVIDMSSRRKLLVFSKEQEMLDGVPALLG